jgi:hypothetical protein
VRGESRMRRASPEAFDRSSIGFGNEALGERSR